MSNPDTEIIPPPRPLVETKRDLRKVLRECMRQGRPVAAVATAILLGLAEAVDDDVRL